MFSSLELEGILQRSIILLSYTSPRYPIIYTNKAWDEM